MSNPTSGHPLIYPQSPFLPEIEKNFVSDVLTLSEDPNLPKSLIVSQVLLDLAGHHHAIVSAHLDFLKQHFQCDQLGLGYWLMGYCNPPYLIIGACIYIKSGIKRALDFLLPDDEGVELFINANEQRKKILPHAVRSLVEFPSGLPIYDLSISYPVIGDQFYLAGQIASRLNFIQLSHEITSNIVH